MDGSGVPGASEEASPAEEFSFVTTPTTGKSSAGHGVSTGQSQEQLQASATGGPPSEAVNPHGPRQSLHGHGVNLTSPMLAKSETRHRRSSSIAANRTFEVHGHQTGGSARHAGSSGISPEGVPLGGPTSAFDRVLGTRNLLKNVKPKSSPVGLGEGSSDDGEDLNGEDVFLSRVPSYRTSTGLESGSAKELSLAIHKHFEPGRRRISILSMDGGGMRGLIAARCLAHLESLLQAKTGKEVKLCDYFDFLAGTSTGAILTTMISAPDEKGDPLFTAQGCCQFYARNGKNIFRPRWYDPWRGSMRQLYRPKYSPRRFEKLLRTYLVRDGKALTMRDTLKPFLVTSFDISKATPHIFVRQAAMKDDSRNFRLWEVCRGTAAAPTYFRPAEVTSTDGKATVTLIDGGAIQNNPSLVALTHVLGNNEEFPEAMGLPDVLILSLGAGQLDEKFDLKKVKKWGMAGWVRPLLNIMMDGSSDTIDYQLAAGFAGHNCSENYLRIQLTGLPKKTALMDCATKENIQDLIQFTDELLQEKAVMRNEYGEKVTHTETYAERLSWFADQLIAQKKLKEDGTSQSTEQYNHNGGPGLGPTNRVVSPMYSSLFNHDQLHHNHLSKPLETAKSVRF